MGNDEVNKHYARYEARLGVSMTKTLGPAVLKLLSLVASLFLPILPRNQTQLEANLFVGHALSSVTCELYYCFTV